MFDLLCTDFSRGKVNSLLCQNITLCSNAVLNKTFPPRNTVIRTVACLFVGIVCSSYLYLTLSVTLESLEPVQVFILLSFSCESFMNFKLASY